MSGSSTLEDNLIDDLVVDVVDSLREELYVDMGIRQHTVQTVRRAWSEERRRGVIVSTVVTTLSPRPLFTDMTKYVLAPAGRVEEGDARLTEVSLTYTEAELTGGVLAPNEEFFYKVSDAIGQAIAPTYYVVKSTPIPDRGEGIGWMVMLHRWEPLLPP